MNDFPHLTFIGAGNMAGSIIGGLVKSDYPAEKITASDPTETNLARLAQKYGIHTCTSNPVASRQAEVLILCVKPQILQAVCEGLAPELTRSPLIISIAAGMDTHCIDTWLGGGHPVIRCMPNTPALVQQGATGMFANEQVTERQRAIASHIFSSVGLVEWVECEDRMHAVTALSGSGPAYFFLIMEALEDAAKKTGMPEQSARKLGIQTMLGAAAMAQQSNLSPGQLKQNVMSPGGTTEQAINTFEARGIREIVDSALHAAVQRSRELSGR
ncbi:MAG: pyrroline-5-carboxylate reductase [Proteobacteria bacterium]|nr:MAG: pyrroline-5-carboxylate reductase [Pseudomonadota bacterium]